MFKEVYTMVKKEIKRLLLNTNQAYYWAGFLAAETKGYVSRIIDINKREKKVGGKL